METYLLLEKFWMKFDKFWESFYHFCLSLKKLNFKIIESSKFM